MLMRSWRQHKVDVHPQEAVAVQEWTLTIEIEFSRELAVSLTFDGKQEMFIIKISGFPGSQNIQQKSAFRWMSKRPLPRCWTWFESATTRADAPKDLSSDNLRCYCLLLHIFVIVKLCTLLSLLLLLLLLLLFSVCCWQIWIGHMASTEIFVENNFEQKTFDLRSTGMPSRGSWVLVGGSFP